MNRRIVVVLISFGILCFAQRQDSIVRVGACTTTGVPWGVYVAGDYAYVATRGGLAVVDASVPSNPHMTDYIDNIDVSALGVVLTDTVAILNAELIGRLTNINVANPDSLTLLGWCYTNSGVGFPEPKGISVLNNIAYQAIRDLGFWIVDISNPDTPIVIDSFDTPRRAIDLFVKENLVYVADYDSLQVVNVAASPFRVGALAMSNACYDVFVVDTFAYVVCESSLWSGINGSLQVVNVSHPESPHIVASTGNLRGDPLDIWISGDYAYVAAADHWFPPREKKQVGGLKPEWTFDKRADVEGGLRVIDISNPLDPILRASYDTPGDPRGVFAVDTLIFVADYDSLQILRHIQTGVEDKDKECVEVFGLLIEPNPFRTSTTIQFQTPTSEHTSLKIYDITGNLVKEFNQKSPVAWYGEDNQNKQLPSGVYLVQLQTASHKGTRKVILLE